LKPIKPGELEQHIKSATVEFLDTREIITLKTKLKSICHFFEPFQIENDTINLRLDWSDIDENGNPTLDADFYDSNTNKKRRLKGERKDVHHTSSIKGEGRMYCWEFKNYQRPFQITVCWLASISATVNVGCTMTAKVIRSTDNESTLSSTEKGDATQCH